MSVSVPTAVHPAARKVRSGTITLNTTSAGFILGLEWGSGTLRLSRGRSYKLRVRTLKAGVIGIESITAHGTVYNLRRLSDINGKYVSGGAGITVGGGVGIQILENSKNVIIELKETSQGLAAKIAASGVDIQLR
ncbi:MAG: hypothetical protein ACTSUD_09185 [Alphaproteobacteria bacterium]